MKKNLTSTQFRALSWLCYYHRRWMAGAGLLSDVAAAANYCENVLNIDNSYIYDITVNGNLAGYQNMNKLASTEYYD